MDIGTRAQGATEYLIILAIVIVIALVAVGVLGGIPGMGGSTGQKTSSAYWKTADIGITSIAITNKTVDATVKNNLADSVTVNNISLGGETIGINSKSLNPGESDSVSGTVTGTVTGVCDNPGDSFSLDVSIDYTNEVNGANYTFTGGGTQIKGTCANY